MRTESTRGFFRATRRARSRPGGASLRQTPARDFVHTTDASRSFGEPLRDRRSLQLSRIHVCLLPPTVADSPGPVQATRSGAAHPRLEEKREMILPN